MIYHNATAEPYYLPYTSDHPHRYHRNIPYSTLLRAARLCSNVDNFNRGRHRIDVALLLSDYPPKTISNEFLRFFQVHQAEPLLKQSDAQAYQRIHQTVVHLKTKKITNAHLPFEISWNIPQSYKRGLGMHELCTLDIHLRADLDHNSLVYFTRSGKTIMDIPAVL